MTKHKTGTRKDWLAARLDLLTAEKEHTRRSDELARRRQALPWVRVDPAYRFETDEGMASRMPGTPVGDNAAMTGTDPATYTRERPGMSAFALEDGIVYHTYSTYARGLDGLWGMYQWLDRAPKGRNERGVWWRRHDEYDQS